MDLLDLFRNEENERSPEQIAPIALAYVGDTVFDLYLRTKLVCGPAMSPHAMHEAASSYAKASSQAQIAQALLGEGDLTEKEAALLKHARNQKSISVPKNASPIDYKWATGFEALLGYLYLSGQEERLYALIAQGIHHFESRKKGNKA